MSNLIYLERLCIIFLFGALFLSNYGAAVPQEAGICDTGSLTANDECQVTGVHNVTGEEIIGETDADLVIKKGARLWGGPVEDQETPRNFSITLQGTGKLVVEGGTADGGVIYGNVEVNAYDIVIEEGGVIDASGLGYQPPTSAFSNCDSTYRSKDGTDYCIGGGPAGGASGDGNSNTGAGGGGHGGRGGSFENSDYYAPGGGREYGTIYDSENEEAQEFPQTFGSAGGTEGSAAPLTLNEAKGGVGHGDPEYAQTSDFQSNAGCDNLDSLVSALENVTRPPWTNQSNPSADREDSDYWIGSRTEGPQYRSSSPYADHVRLGAGGGRIILSATNTLENNGSIIANGLQGGGDSNNGYAMGAGAGGSISISAGGIFGKGFVKADGGEFSSYMAATPGDRDPSDGYTGGGGGGRIFYEYSVRETDWNMTADAGQGSVDICQFTGSTNDNQRKEETAEDGVITGTVAFDTEIDKKAVNPGETINIEGTSSTDVKAYFNDTETGNIQKVGELSESSLPSNGSFSFSVEALNRSTKNITINDFDDLGNYSLIIESQIRGSPISDSYEISHQSVEMNFTETRNLFESGASVTPRVYAYRWSEREGGLAKTPVSNRRINFTLIDQGGPNIEFNGTTDATGLVNISDDSIEMPDTTGEKKLLAEVRTKNDIKSGQVGNGTSQLGSYSTENLILKPGENVLINVTSHSDVNISLYEDSPIQDVNKSVQYDGGTFNTTIQTQSTLNHNELGNYTLSLATILDGNRRVKSFNVSHRDLLINLTNEYGENGRTTSPGEDFVINGSVVRFSGNTGEGGQLLSDNKVVIDYEDENGYPRSKEIFTDQDGEFSTNLSFNQAGVRSISLRSETNYIGTKRKEAITTLIDIYDFDVYSKPQYPFKETNISRKSVINPGRPLLIESDIARSLDFVEQVFTDIQKPDETMESVSLQSDFQGETIDNFVDGDVINIDTRINQGERSANNLRLGYDGSNNESLILFYTFENTEQEVVDTVGTKNGSGKNQPNRDTPGVFSTSGVKFDEANEAIDVGNPSELDFGPSSTFSLTFWLKADGNAGTIFSRSDSTFSNVDPEVRVTGSNEVVAIFDKEGESRKTLRSETDAIVPNQWTQITLVYDNTTAALFKGSERVDKAENIQLASSYDNQEGVTIGATSGITDGGPGFTGKIDELMIFDENLTNHEIKSLYDERGTFEYTFDTAKSVSDEFRVLDINKSLNNGNITLKVYSNPGTPDQQTSKKLNIGQDTLYTVAGIDDPAKRFKLGINLSTNKVGSSPVLEGLAIKARKDKVNNWNRRLKASELTEFGNYSFSLDAEDKENNSAVQSPIEKVERKTLNISTAISGPKTPGEAIEIGGDAEIIRGDGTGDKIYQGYNGTLNAVFNNTAYGQNSVREYYRFKNVSGTNQVVNINGTETPDDNRVIFEGVFQGVEERLSWNNTSDWLPPGSRGGMVIESVEGSPFKTDKEISMGYAAIDRVGRELSHYIHLDDRSKPFTDAVGNAKISARDSINLNSAEIAGGSSISMGNGQYLSISNISAAETNPEDLGVNFLIKPESLGSKILEIRNLVAINSTEDGQLRAENLQTGDSAETTGIGSLQENEWSMITVSIISGDVKISTGIGSDSNTISGSLSYNNEPLNISNGFSGKVTDIRIYDGNLDGAELSLRNYVGNSDTVLGGTEYATITSNKSFDAPVEPESLILEANSTVDNQSINLTVQSNGQSANPVRLRTNRTRYPINASDLPTSDSYTIKVEILGKLGASVSIEDIDLLERQSPKNPRVRVNQTTTEVEGDLLGGTEVQKELDALSPGLNNIQFMSDSGQFNAEIRFDERLRRVEKSSIDVANGQFSFEVQAPNVSGKENVLIYKTTENGLAETHSKEIPLAIDFDEVNISAKESGDKILGPDKTLKINVSLLPVENMDRVWAEIETPQKVYERDLIGQKTEWERKLSVNGSTDGIYDGVGQYNVSIKAESNDGTREAEPYNESVRLTKGVIKSSIEDTAVGKGRLFEINGTLRQSGLDRVNGSVRASLASNMQTTSTNESGEFSLTVGAPRNPGTYQLKLNATDENLIETSESTDVEVVENTSLNITKAPDRVPVEGVSTTSGVEKFVDIRIRNLGEEDAEGAETYTFALPSADDERILEDFGGGDWQSINQTANIRSGESKNVSIGVNISKASQDEIYTIGAGVIYNTTGGEKVNDTVMVDVEIVSAPVLEFSNDIQQTISDGFDGNLVSPSTETATRLENTGSGASINTYYELNSSIRDGKQIDSWINGFTQPTQESDPTALSERLDPATDTIDIVEIDTNIPRGTPPGNYSTRIEPNSSSPEDRIPADLNITVEESPEFRIEFEDNQGVTETSFPIKEINESTIDQINLSNPVQINNMAIQNAESVFNMTLVNEGNTNLTWTFSSGTTEGDLQNVFYFNQTKFNAGNEGTDTKKSKVIPEENYTYDISRPNQTLRYNLGDDLSGTYQANISVQCKSIVDGKEEDCFPSETINIPLNATISNPPPSFRNVKFPDIVGRGKTVSINGIVEEPTGDFVADNVDTVNVIVTGNLEGDIEQKTFTDVDFNQINGSFSVEVVPDKNGSDDLLQNDHEYTIELEATDNAGNTNRQEVGSFVVRDEADLDLSLNNTEVDVDNVTATSGGSITLNGNVTTGSVKVANLSLNYIDQSDIISQRDFTTEGLFGDNTESNIGFTLDLETDPGLNPNIDRNGIIGVSWDNPDGSQSDTTIEIDMNIQQIKEMEIIQEPTNQPINVDHGDTVTTSTEIRNDGNTELTGIELICLSCGSEPFSTSFDTQDFDLNPGESELINFNVTAELRASPELYTIDIGVSHDDGQQVISDIVFDIPEDKRVEISPNMVERAIILGEDGNELTEVVFKNIGNVETSFSMDADDAVGRGAYLGSEPPLGNETISISPGGNATRMLKSDGSAETIDKGTNIFELYPEGENVSYAQDKGTINTTLIAQEINLDVLNLTNTSTGKNIVNPAEPEQFVTVNDSVSLEANLTQEGEPVNDTNGVDLTLIAEETEYEITETYNQTSETWQSTFTAPNLTDGVQHDFRISASSDSYISSVEDKVKVQYEDITPAEVVESTIPSVAYGENSSITLTLSDQTNQSRIEAQISEIDGNENTTIAPERFNPQDNNGLEEINERTWTVDDINVSASGLFEVKYVFRDQNGNEGTFKDFFRVYEPISLEGDAAEPTEETRLELYDRGSDEPVQVIKPIEVENKNYNWSEDNVQGGEFPEVHIRPDSGVDAVVENYDTRSLATDPPQIDGEIRQREIDIDSDFLDGFAVESSVLETIPSGGLGFNYSTYLSSIESLANLNILACDDFDVDQATPCQSGWNSLEGNVGIDTEQERVATDIGGFSSYILVEETESTGLKDIAGELESLSDLSDVADSLQSAASTLEDSGDNNVDVPDSSFPSTFPDQDDQDLSENDTDRLIELLNETNQAESLSISDRRLRVSVAPGGVSRTAISVQNNDEKQNLSFSATSNIDEITNLPDNISLESNEFRQVEITVNASKITRIKDRSGFLLIEGEDMTRQLEIAINVESESTELLDLTIEPTKTAFQPGESARIQIMMDNKGLEGSISAESITVIRDISQNQTISRKTASYQVSRSNNPIMDLELPENVKSGTYEVRTEVVFDTPGGNVTDTSIDQIKVNSPFLDRSPLILQNSTWLLLFIIAIVGGTSVGGWYYRRKKLEKKRERFEEQVDNEALPRETGRSAFIGKLSEIGTRAFLNLDDLVTHCLVAGATGAGKSVAAQVVVEEALEKGINVIVLDPTGQWSGFMDKNDDTEFKAFYEDFGMQETDARRYDGNIRAVDPDQKTINVTDHLRNEEEEGSIYVFSLHKMENAELDEYIANTIQSIFDANPDEKDELNTLIVYDEAHRVLEKFGGSGQGVKKLEKATREFRKWGIGLIMISQVISDFREEIRANIGTQIQMRTEYEGDLDRIGRKYGNNISQGVTKASTGSGMIENASYNHGRPYFVDFRPIKHSSQRLSDEVLEQFERYNRRIDEIQDMLSILEDSGEDTFEYESRLNLVRKNLRKRNFNLVDTYIEELEDDLEEKLNL